MLSISNNSHIQFVSVGVAATASLYGIWRTYHHVKNNMEYNRLAALRRQKQEEKRQNKERMRQYLLLNPLTDEEINDIVNLCAIDIIKRLKNKSLDYQRVLLAFQHKAYEVNKKVNCIVEFLFPDISEVNLDGPLAGLPISVKDNFCLKGHDSHIGCSKFIHKPAENDCVPVKLLKNLGGIPFVKTSVSQTMMSTLGCNPIDGITRNPHNTERTSGGSSAGEAALIASRGSPLGFGTDIGGSIRLPAAYCGITGIKLTQGMISKKGMMSPSSSPLLSGMWGPLSQDVESLIEILRLLVNSPLQYKLDSLLNQRVFNEESLSERKLKIGYLHFDGFFRAVPCMERAVTIAKDLLTRQGHELVQFNFPFNARHTFTLYMKSVMADGGKLISSILENDAHSSSIKNSLVLYNLSSIKRFMLINKLKYLQPDADILIPILASTGLNKASEVFQIYSDIENTRAQLAKAWQEAGLDALILPAVGTPAVPVEPVSGFTGALSYLNIFNLLNFPAGSLPVGKVEKKDLQLMNEYPDHTKWYRSVKSFQPGTEGLPIGVQVATLPFQDELCLRVMLEIERGVRA